MCLEYQRIIFQCKHVSKCPRLLMVSSVFLTASLREMYNQFEENRTKYLNRNYMFHLFFAGGRITQKDPNVCIIILKRKYEAAFFPGKHRSKLPFWDPKKEWKCKVLLCLWCRTVLMCSFSCSPSPPPVAQYPPVSASHPRLALDLPRLHQEI